MDLPLRNPLRSLGMFGSSAWRLFRGCGSSWVSFSTRAWYQLFLKQRGLGKPEADHSVRVKILGPQNPLGREELLKLLAASVVHRDDALVAFSKPPGLPVSGKPGELTFLSLLPDLSQKLGLPQDLQVIKAAVKESSGLVLLSGCPNTCLLLQDFYTKSRRAKCPAATYCAVTTRIPAALEGEVRTGLKLMPVEDFDLVVPVASPSQRSLERREVKNTRTLYKVLDSCDGCALLQLQPLSAFTGQLLVHLTLILSPVLGDHVYSSRVGTVLGEPFLLPAETTLPRTQILEESLLKKLHVQQQQVHRLPLHLHLHQLLLPTAASSSTTTVLTAPLPPYFLQTLSLLGLALPQDKQGEKTSKALAQIQKPQPTPVKRTGRP
ncbi:mitochondrial mRNA pseudouridine synthase RPUSD3 [Varanus komodoensis]|uniref:mitochondrial mRNA pseudouridine synthase RPUSD3 n=1 Tax=Varanus komodoensis TaxID=61221 RepID=UPI001CF78E2C|nr:mitochondrial mRNA pseudouridine synthase RPUSD3 [Varanus komodoensis]